MRSSTFFLALLALQTANATIFISIGQDCSVAAALRTTGRRTEAYPFDWNISRFSALYAAFKEQFTHFVQEDSLTVRADGQGIVDYYGFEFVHDFPTIHERRPVASDEPLEQAPVHPEWKNALKEVQRKYARRIERLQKALQGSERVYLIRHFGMDKHQAKQFCELLIRLYPKLDFVLVIVGNTEGLEKTWKLKRVKNFYLEDRVIWNDPQQWEAIFRDLESE